MSNMIILSPMAATVTATRGTGVDNLLKRSPKAVWQDSVNDGSGVGITIDLGTNRNVDTIALIGTNAAAGTDWSITSGLDGEPSSTSVRLAAGALMRAPSDVAVPEFQPATWPAFFHSTAGFDARRIAINFGHPAGAGALQVGCVLVGKAFKPSWNREWDSGRGIIDTGSRSRLPDGGIGGVDGVAVPTFDFTLGDLTDAELAHLWALVRNRRTTRPALVVEDPTASAGLAERIHYGTFVNIEKYGRRAADKTRWAFQFEDWL